MPRSISAISFSFRFQRRFSGRSHINSPFTLSLSRTILYIHKNVSSLRRNGCRKPWNENENSTNRNMVRFCIRIIMEVFERWWWRLVIGLTDFYFKYITTQWLWSSTHKVWMWMFVCVCYQFMRLLLRMDLFPFKNLCAVLLNSMAMHFTSDSGSDTELFFHFIHQGEREKEWQVQMHIWKHNK